MKSCQRNTVPPNSRSRRRHRYQGAAAQPDTYSYEIICPRRVRLVLASLAFHARDFFCCPSYTGLNRVAPRASEQASSPTAERILCYWRRGLFCKTDTLARNRGKRRKSMAIYSPSLEEVQELAATGNTIPVFRELHSRPGDAGFSLSEVAERRPLLSAGIGGKGGAGRPLQLPWRTSAPDLVRPRGSDGGRRGRRRRVGTPPR